jgi:hypothetical protein
MQTEKHITLLAILHIVYSSFGVLGGVLVFCILSWAGVFLQETTLVPGRAPIDAIAILSTVGFIIAVGLMLLAIPGIVGGIGLLRKKEWARILILIVGFLDLVRIPLGTALGIYTIWVLMSSDIVQAFNPPTPPTGPST